MSRVADPLEEPRRGEPLRRDVEQPHVPGDRALDRAPVGRGVLLGVDERHAAGRHALERLDLVLHQRHERRDHERQVRPHQRRQLVAERLARARGHHHQHVARRRAPASTASRWPGRKAAKPNSSRSAAPGSVARATGSGGGGPEAREGDVVHERVTRDGRPYRRLRRASGRCGDLQRSRCGRRDAGRAQARASGQRVLERVLGLRGGRPGQRVVAGEAGVAVRVARPADRLVDALQREVGQRVAAQLGGDLGLRAPVGDHLLARRHVDAVVAGMADRRRGDAHVDLARARVAQHLHDLAGRVAAHDRVVDDHEPLAADHLGQRVELHPQAVLAQLLARAG